MFENLQAGPLEVSSPVCRGPGQKTGYDSSHSCCQKHRRRSPPCAERRGLSASVTSRFLIRGPLNLAVSQKVGVTIYLQGYIVSAPLRLQVFLQKKEKMKETKPLGPQISSVVLLAVCGHLEMMDLLLSNYVPGTCTVLLFLQWCFTSIKY